MTVKKSPKPPKFDPETDRLRRYCHAMIEVLAKRRLSIKLLTQAADLLKLHAAYKEKP
jgi:hypothetical protein